MSPRLGGEDRDRPDPQSSIQTKIRVKPDKEPILNHNNITNDPEYKRAKIIPPQHIIRMLWTKQLNHRGKSPQEYFRTDNNKVHTLEPQ